MRKEKKKTEEVVQKGNLHWGKEKEFILLLMVYSIFSLLFYQLTFPQFYHILCPFKFPAHSFLLSKIVCIYNN